VSNLIRIILWTAISLGMIVLAIMAFWIVLVVIGVVILGRLIYLKFFPGRQNSSHGTFTIHTYTIRPGARNNEGNTYYQNQRYTTVIDADDPEKEYRIPKIK
jgi:cell division protein FtsW (lipid II flippase)